MIGFLLILAEASIRIAIIAAAVGLLLIPVRARTVRHAAWAAVICTMLAMPLLLRYTPAIPVPIRFVPMIQRTDLPERNALTQADEIVQRLNAGSPKATAETAVTTSSAVEAAIRVPEAGIPKGGPLSLETFLVGLYVIGFIAFAVRFFIGWREALRIGPRGQRRIRISEHVAAPVTIGLLSPKILLPPAFRGWPRVQRRAVLAHEIAHIRRRDPLVRFVSQINSCVFWFHPLAWWLERQVSVDAEYACDDAAIAAIRNRRAYAETLLDMARTVRAAGGRIVRHGMGVFGNGLFEKRIESVLASGSVAKPTTIRKIVIGLCCASAIFLGVACEQQARPSLQDEQQALIRVLNKQVHETPSATREDAAFDRLRRLSPPLQPDGAAIDELEKKVSKDPDDLDLRLKLLFTYERPMARGELRSKYLLARRRHILWIIENHPEDEFAGSSATFIRTRETNPLFTPADPEGYAEAKQLWLSQISKKPMSVAVLANAASGFEIDDKALAANLLERARAIQPSGALTAQLARVYVLALLGATAEVPTIARYSGNVAVQAQDDAQAYGPFANEARRKLDASRDDELLLDTGADLVRIRNLAAGFDYRALGKHYLTRSAALNPNSNARGILVQDVSEQQENIREERVRQLPKDNRYEAAAALPDRDRFDLFWTLARNAFDYGNSFDSLHPADAKKEWVKAEKYATDLLAVAPRFRRDPAYPLAIFNANLLLAQIAARTNDIDGAVQYLRAASKAPKQPDDLFWPGFGGYRGLCNILIARGRKNDVIDFLDHVAMLDSQQRDQVLAVAAQLRLGDKPSWYGF